MTEIPKNVEASQKEEYENYTASLVKAIAAAKEYHWPITFGPTYSMQSRAGSEVTVSTAAINYQDPRDAHKMVYKALLFFARDETGNVLGHRLTRLKDQPDSIEAWGKIAVKERGKGIATIIESAHMDLLRHEAAVRRKEVLYEIKPGNRWKLGKLRENIPSDAPAEQINILLDKEKENQRWEGLYGEGGILQADQDLVIRIAAQQQNRLPDNIDEVTLAREEGERLATKRADVIEISDKSAWQAIQDHDLNEKILPQLTNPS